MPTTIQKNRLTNLSFSLPNHQQNGITFIEILIVIGILTLSAFVATPYIQSWRQNLEANNLFIKISPVLKAARSSAALHNSAVSVCGGSPSSCTGRWRDGMLTFIDINHNGAIDIGNDLILSHTPLELDFGDLAWRGAGGRAHILYQENGLPRGSNGSFRYCGQERKYHRSVVLSMMGHTRRSPDRNQDGIYEDTNGLPFICS